MGILEGLKTFYNLLLNRQRANIYISRKLTKEIFLRYYYETKFYILNYLARRELNLKKTNDNYPGELI